MKTHALLLLGSLLLCLLSLVMCGNDNNDDDDNDNDTSGANGADFLEGKYCTGYDYTECGTVEDKSPHLNKVDILINGLIREQPLIIQPADELTFSIEFSYPDNRLCDGHIFIIKSNESYCLDQADGTLSNNPMPMGISGICSTDSLGEPYSFPVDPSIFLNGEGAPYYLEISNACATRSNRLPLDIVTVAE